MSQLTCQKSGTRCQPLSLDDIRAQISGCGLPARVGRRRDAALCDHDVATLRPALGRYHRRAKSNVAREASAGSLGGIALGGIALGGIALGGVTSGGIALGVGGIDDTAGWLAGLLASVLPRRCCCLRPRLSADLVGTSSSGRLGLKPVFRVPVNSSQSSSQPRHGPL